MRNSFKLMLACVFAAQVFAAGAAISRPLTLGEGQDYCGPPKGLGCGGCATESHGKGSCWVVWCDKSQCNIETFRRAPGSTSGGKGVLFRVRGPAR